MFTRMNCMVAVSLVWAFAGVVAGQGVVAWFEFEDNLLDSSGHVYTPSVAGAPTYVDGRTGYGKAIRVAATDSVRWTDLPKPTAITVSVWVKLDTGSPVGTSWLLGDLSSGWYGWEFKPDKQSATTARVQWQLADSSGTRRTTYGTTNSLFDGQWHHIVGTHDGVTTATVYYDGNQVGQTTNYSFRPTAAGVVTALNNLSQGGSSGDVDDISIWNRALTPAEVADLHDVGVPWPFTVLPRDAQAIIALKDSPAPGPVVHTVFNTDSGATHTIDIAEVDQDGNSTDYAWLSLSTTQIVNLPASSDTTVNAIIDHSALAPGVYTAYLNFSDDSTPAKELIREIRLTVLGCQWSVTPGSVGRYYLNGSGDPVPPAVYTVTNTGKHGLTYTVQEVVDQSWLTLDKGGSLSPLDYQATDVVTAAIDPTGLAVGQYSCNLRLTNNCDPTEELVYTITLNVQDAVVGPGLLAYYRFEDSARDWTGNGWTGTPSGTPTYTEGQYGRAIEFDGPVGNPTGDGMNLGDIPVGSDMSVALWFRSDVRHKAWLVNKITSADGLWKGWQIKNYLEWQGLDWETPVLRFTWCHDGLRDSLNTSGVNNNRDIAVPDLYDGNWHLIAFTIEDTDGDLGNQVNVRAYYDGELVRGPNIWGPPHPQDEIAFERLGTSFQPAPADVDVWISGDIDRVLGGVDELSLWNRALTPEQIAYIFATGFLDTRLWPDPDEDGDVDMQDFALWQRCYTGSGGAIADTASCARFDRNGDNDIDEADFHQFENCATGPSIPFDGANPPVGCAL